MACFIGKEITENGISPRSNQRINWSKDKDDPGDSFLLMVSKSLGAQHSKERRRSEGGRVLKNSDNSRIFEKTLLENKR
jgi:hypothetical protein